MPFFTAELPLNTKKEAEFKASLYGASPMIENPTPEQIEVMRNLVLTNDQKHSNQTFDLSKPPTVPYVFREFPKTLYKHAECLPSRVEVRKTAHGDSVEHLAPKFVTKIVPNADELKKALNAGWVEDAPVFETPEESVDAVACAAPGKTAPKEPKSNRKNPVEKPEPITA